MRIRFQSGVSIFTTPGYDFENLIRDSLLRLPSFQGAELIELLVDVPPRPLHRLESQRILGSEGFSESE